MELDKYCKPDINLNHLRKISNILSEDWKVINNDEDFSGFNCITLFNDKYSINQIDYRKQCRLNQRNNYEIFIDYIFGIKDKYNDLTIDYSLSDLVSEINSILKDTNMHVIHYYHKKSKGSYIILNKVDYF